MYAPWLPDRTKAERAVRTNISGAERLLIFQAKLLRYVCVFSHRNECFPIQTLRKFVFTEYFFLILCPSNEYYLLGLSFSILRWLN